MNSKEQILQAIHCHEVRAERLRDFLIKLGEEGYSWEEETESQKREALFWLEQIDRASVD